MDVHSTSLKGLRRQNEDKHNIILNLNGKNDTMNNVNFYSVYDGHGGKYVSEFLYKTLYKYFMNRKIKYPLNKNTVDVIYDHVQQILRTTHKNTCIHTGSTSLVAIQFKQDLDNYLHVINVGDCRGVLCKDNIAQTLTKDHKPIWPEEKDRIESLGGTIYFDDDWRVKDLSVSRAFGDLAATPYVTHRPDFFKYKLGKNDKFIILACDGLWDVLTPQEAVNYVLLNCYNGKCTHRINKNVNISDKIAKYAIERGSSDNITAIVVFL